jgi:heterodisulfide reductase subunit B
VIYFYPGCTLGSSARHYYRSLHWVLRRLGFDLQELPGWSCCGATSAHALSKDLSYALPARNLALAQELQSDLLVACSACYSRLKITQKVLDDSQMKAHVEQIIGSHLDGRPQIKNVLEVLTQTDYLKRIEQARTKALQGRKVACYYGCLATRMPRVQGFDRVEDPNSMERLVVASGATPVEWPYKTECCGASLSVINEAISLKMCERILEMARRCGAELVVTSCPFCQYNLDWAQWEREQKDTKASSIPVIFITQLLGLALGGSEKDLMIGANLAGSEKALCLAR